MKKFSKIIFLAILNFSFSNIQSFSQTVPGIEWAKCYGGTNWEYCYSMKATNDGGYILTGDTKSNNGDVSGKHGLSDCWVLKIDSIGIIQWQKCLGGSNADVGYAIQQTIDSGYIVAGSTSSNNGDVSGLHGANDAWIVKLDTSGNIQWQKCLGGTLGEFAWSIEQTFDKGYIIGGATTSNDGDVFGNHDTSGGSFRDYWVVKIDSIGNIQWQKCLGGTWDDYGYQARQTADSGYVVIGSSVSNDGDVTANHGAYDCWVVKLDGGGAIQWEKCLGGTSTEHIWTIQLTNDLGYILPALTTSNDGDVTGHHGDWDYWIVRLDSMANIQWQKCLGGSYGDMTSSIIPTSDGGYIINGTTYSNDGDVTGLIGSFDFWIVKIDNTGNIQWQKCMGGTDQDEGWITIETNEGGFINAGSARSIDVNVTGNHGNYDFWVVKLYPDNIFLNTQLPNYLLPISVSPNPFTNKLNIAINNKEFAEIILYDISSRKLLQQKFTNSISINTEQLAKGIYLYEVRNKNGVIKKGKVVKE